MRGTPFVKSLYSKKKEEVESKSLEFEILFIQPSNHSRIYQIFCFQLIPFTLTHIQLLQGTKQRKNLAGRDEICNPMYTNFPGFLKKDTKLCVNS